MSEILLYDTTTSTDEDQRLDGWSIDNRRYARGSDDWVSLPRVIKLAVLGSPAWVTNEADGPDLPGAGHNAHKTGAVVTPGIVSTGHLTAGLDRNHGLYGDYWWLDTQWNHSYRIEVKFGASPNTATGGSAWVYFIDGDRRGTCCDSDHNRNDGYTVLHFKHDQNQKYLIDVVVFDKLNSGSRNFNGAYTITMTDITGTDKLVSNLYLGTLTKVAATVGTDQQYASSFTAGHNPGGYKLDRIRTHIPDDHSAPVLALHTDTSFAPGAKLCDFRNPTQVQHLVYWEDFPAPIPFTAPDCADVTLAANGTYWIVFAGAGYKPVVTDVGGESTRESGWSIGNTALTKTTGAWGDLTGGVIAAEIWATTDLSRTRPDVPSVTVSFEQGTYTVAEGGTVEVTVTLDPDPERTVTIPITKANQGTASDADYSGVPANVVFNSGETEKRITFSATQDTIDDDGESVRLAFGSLPPEVSAGTPTETTVTITDPPSTAATGDPLVRGERKVGSTLTGDTKGIADPNGLTNPGFNYQWQRMENGMPVDIPGAVSETYTLTDDDVGKRVQLQVQFNDDEGNEETRTGPGTSVITKAPHLLVGNLTQNPNGRVRLLRVQSTGFNTGMHEFGYVIDSATAYRDSDTPVNDGEAEIRIHGSTSEPNAIDRRPLAGVLVVTASDLTRTNNYITGYSARSRAKLNPSTTYHLLVAALDGGGPHSCRTALGEGLDSNSLPGFSINDRSYGSHQTTLSTIDSVQNACALAIKGSELQSSNFVQDLEFTSTPAQPMIYATGETIEATVMLNQAVTFDGPPPVLLLQIGNNQREITYVASASTGSSWVFRYTVTANDRDDDGMSFNRFALRGYADADLSNNRVINDPEHRVNAVSQIVSRRVSSKPIAPIWYGPGEKIQFTLGFSLPVTVVGDPQLEFSITTPGPQNEFASYLSGSGTKELVFSYTVLAVDDDADGIWWNADSLRLDSDDSITGTINGLDADLDHTALNKLENHRIDQNPRAVSQEVTSDPVGGTSSDTYGAGDMITFEVVFNQPVTVNGAPRLRFSITGGTGDEYATYVSGGTNTLVFSYTVLAADMDADGIYLYMNPLDYPDSAADSIVGTSNSLDAVNGIGKGVRTWMPTGSTYT